MTAEIFSILAPLFFIAGVGFLYGVKFTPQMDMTNRLILDVLVPALIISVMIKESFEIHEHIPLMFAGLGVMLGSGLIAFALAKVIGLDWRVVTPPAMFSNWANLGLPLYVFAIGAQALDGGVMLVVVGNILLFTLGAYIYANSVSLAEIIRTPVLISVVVGVVFSATGLNAPDFVVVSLDMLGQGAIPLMLFSLGVRLTKVSWVGTRDGIIMAIFCPLVGVPLAIMMAHLLPLTNLQTQILILFGVLPPAVVNFIIAERYSEHPERVASIVLIGNLFAVISFPVLLYFFLPV